MESMYFNPNIGGVIDPVKGGGVKMFVSFEWVGGGSYSAGETLCGVAL